MIEDHRPGESPGSWKKYWRRATEIESQEIIADINVLAEQQVLINKMKKEKPELFI